MPWPLATPIGATATTDYFRWLHRHDAWPLALFIDAFVAYHLSTIDLGRAHRGLAALISAVATLGGFFLFEIIIELSVVAASTAASITGLDTSAYVLRLEWGGAEPLLGDALVRVGGVLLAAVATLWLRVPAFFRLEDKRHYRASAWKHLAQRCLVGYAPLYLGPAPTLLAYAAVKTLTLVAVVVWNRADRRDLERLYGCTRSYDVSWLSFFVLYAVLFLVGGAVDYAVTPLRCLAAMGAALVATTALTPWRADVCYSPFAGFKARYEPFLPRADGLRPPRVGKAFTENNSTEEKSCVIIKK